MENIYAEKYLKDKEIEQLTDIELLKLGKKYANLLIDWGTSPNYGPWEFESEELPFLIDDGVEVGLLRKRKSHVELVEHVVYDEQPQFCDHQR